MKAIYSYHQQHQNDATLVVSQRQTSRYLLFDKDNRLNGWVNESTGQTKPEGFIYSKELFCKYAFSGIHVISPSLFRYMDDEWTGKFSITEFYLNTCHKAQYGAFIANHLQLMDIGKPETIVLADQFINKI